MSEHQLGDGSEEFNRTTPDMASWAAEMEGGDPNDYGPSGGRREQNRDEAHEIAVIEARQRLADASPHQVAKAEVDRAAPSQPEESRQPKELPAYIGDVVLPPGVLGNADNSMAHLRPAANQLLGKMLDEPATVQTLLERENIGTDFSSDERVSEIMALYALPYLERAEKAQAAGKPKRSAIYRELGSDAANQAVRAIRYRPDAVNPISLHVPGAGFVEQKSPKKPWNALRDRNWSERKGLSLKALLQLR